MLILQLMAPIDGILCKLSRAYEHLEAFNKEVRVYLEGEPYKIIPDLKLKKEATYSLTVKLSIAHHPPAILSILAGEVVYQVRSALDHLAYQLAVTNVGLNSDLKRCEFPIFIDKGKYHRVTGRGLPERNSGLDKVRSIAPAAQATIAGLQPYNRRHNPKTHPLWLLHELCNIDKHRRFHLVGVPIGRISTIQDGTFKVASVRIFDKRPLKDGTIIMCATVFACSGFPGKVTVKHEIPPQIAFEEAIALPQRYAGEVLKGILIFIDKSVLPKLKPFL
jgi:hypothetical protein